jgi:hypothetical protein
MRGLRAYIAANYLAKENLLEDKIEGDVSANIHDLK